MPAEVLTDAELVAIMPHVPRLLSRPLTPRDVADLRRDWPGLFRGRSEPQAPAPRPGRTLVVDL